ncbi:hypothetical protein OF83DRAFT_1185796 [Amylostereum chailletii]|nr:hypothetical protein OF83DRAFT_1185796 [Amylostereum chailletii]
MLSVVYEALGTSQGQDVGNEERMVQIPEGNKAGRVSYAGTTVPTWRTDETVRSYYERFEPDNMPAEINVVEKEWICMRIGYRAFQSVNCRKFGVKCSQVCAVYATHDLWVDLRWPDGMESFREVLGVDVGPGGVGDTLAYPRLDVGACSYYIIIIIIESALALLQVEVSSQAFLGRIPPVHRVDEQPQWYHESVINVKTICVWISSRMIISSFTVAEKQIDRSRASREE